MAKDRRVTLRAEQLEQRILMAVDAFHVGPELDLTEVEFRTIDGTANNAEDTEQGAANTQVIRFGYPGVYPDGHGDVIDVEGRPNARDISNAIHAQDESVLSQRLLTDWVFQWGQFLTHDLDLTTNGSEFNTLSDGTVGDFSIAINDPSDPLGPNPIPFNRTEFDPTTGTPDLIDGPFGPRPNWREQINLVTSYIDASNVYGSDDARAAALRTFEGGKLITSDDGLLPGLNDAGLGNDDPFGQGADQFLAGDVRANEQVGLTAVHSLFVREHNRLADEIGSTYPELNDEEIYQLARRIVGAEMQAITFNEYLPSILGYENAPKAADAAYDAELNAAVTNSFAAAIFRFGHSQISEEMLLVNNAGETVDSLGISQAFFNIDFLKDDSGNVDLILKGLASQVAQENDLLLVDGIRNTLFGPAGSGGLDLAALDIQRGRDHGLPDYNSLRMFYGLERVTSFEEISSDPAIQMKLEELYGNIDNIDAFVGALAEDHVPGSSVGALVNAVISNQFTRLRDGDRFFYTNDELLNSREVQRIIDLDNVTLSKVIQWNSDITNIQDNVFFDESVLFYQVPAGRRASEVTVAIRGDDVVIHDRNHEVARESLANVAQVMLVGADGRRDVFNLHIAGADGGLEQGVVIHGGTGENDLLRVHGARGADKFVVDGTSLSINDTDVDFNEIERLLIFSNSRNDDVTVVDDSAVDVRVVESQRSHRRDSQGGRRRFAAHDFTFGQLFSNSARDQSDVAGSRRDAQTSNELNLDAVSMELAMENLSSRNAQR